ncbi:MAG: C1q-like domain-containing protein, partial [Pseudomonadales bacterium]
SELRVTTLKHESATVNNITLAANGNVGIGINAPTGRLQVIGAAGSELLIGYAGASTNYIDADTQIFRNGGKAELMRIDSVGRVTMPYQPGFYARRTIPNDGRPVGAQEWAVTGLGSYNTGGHFNASNGRFTAPVSGQYIFAAAPGYKQTGQLLSFYYQINGTYMAEPVRLNNETSHGLATGTIVVYLTQGDYVLIHMNGIHHVNVSFNFFTGHLLG